MSEAFTPGPWDYERDPDAHDLPRPWVGNLAKGRYSALACGSDDDEVQANARLIAAAPDMLKALEAFAAASADAWPEAALREAEGLVRAALAKAKGSDLSPTALSCRCGCNNDPFICIEADGSELSA